MRVLRITRDSRSRFFASNHRAPSSRPLPTTRRTCGPAQTLYQAHRLFWGNARLWGRLWRRRHTMRPAHHARTSSVERIGGVDAAPHRRAHQSGGGGRPPATAPRIEVKPPHVVTMHPDAIARRQEAKQRYGSLPCSHLYVKTVECGGDRVWRVVRPHQSVEQS